MADKSVKSATGGDAPKKPVNSRLEQAQKRAQAMTSGGRKPIGAAQFAKEAWIELKKTTWPDKEETFKSTVVVLALVVATGIFVGVLDYVLSIVVNPLFQS